MRATVGAALIVVGGPFMTGAFFVPPAEMLRDPGLIPMPERCSDCG